MGFKKPASEQQANYSCGKCGEKFIKDKEIFMQKKDDGTWFSCHNLECFKSQGGTIEEKKSFGGKFTSSKFPISEYVSIYKKAEELLVLFKETRKDKEISITEEIVFIESMVRTLSGNFKP